MLLERDPLHAETRESMLARLADSNSVVCWAVVQLYKRQTADEQRQGVTSHSNGQGFTAIDAQFGTSLAKQILTNEQTKRYPQHLSDKQLGAARKMLRKYASQLASVVNE
jgi:predicted NAD/FAD-dependent oxidoreductase